MRSRVLEPYVPEAATPSVPEAATICTRYFVSWWDTEDDARDSAEGAEAREEAKLPPQKRKQAYLEVLPQLLQRFSARIATDGDKMLVCAMQLPRQADGPIVLHSESARVFVRIQPSTATRQALADPGGQQCIDIILGHAGALKVRPPRTLSSAACPWGRSNATLSSEVRPGRGFATSDGGGPTLKTLVCQAPGPHAAQGRRARSLQRGGEHAHHAE